MTDRARLSRVLLLAVAAFLYSVAAWGQQAVLQGGPNAAGHIPQYVGWGTQQPIIQDGGTSGGGPAGVNPSTFGLTARGTGTPPYANQGAGPNHENMCLYDAPTTNAGGFHYVCLDPNAGGGGLLSYGSGGGAPTLPFNFLFNGLPLPNPSLVPFFANNGATFATSDPDRFGQILNVRSDFGAPAGLLGVLDGVAVANTAIITSASTTFTAANIGESYILTGSGACTGSTCAPQIGTIIGVPSTHSISVSATPITAVPWSQTYFGVLATFQSGAGSYAPNDTLTCTGGVTVTAACIFSIQQTTVVSAAVTAGGSGGTPGACTVTGTTGTASGGIFFRASGTVSGGGALAGALTVLVGSSYTVNPSNLAAEPVTVVSGCGALTGATLALNMGAFRVVNTNPGHYGTLPTSPVTTTTSGSGTGATLTLVPTQGGGQLSYANDSSPAFVTAINNMNAKAAAGIPICLHVPAGFYFLKAQTLPLMTHGGCIIGEGGTNATIIAVDPSYVGDVFSWSDAWLNIEIPFAGQTGFYSALAAGPRVSGLNIVGNRGAVGQQNAFMLYDHTDWANFDDITVSYMNGHGIGSGFLKNDTVGYMRESRFNRMRFYNMGGPGVATIEGQANGQGGSNDVRWAQTDIYAPYGPGILLHAGANTFLGEWHWSQTRVEGIEGNGPGITGDLIQIGDAALTGSVTSIYFDQLQLVDPYAGSAAIHTIAPTLASRPDQIWVTNGTITGGAPYGRGVQIDSGSNINMKFSSITTFDTNVTIGSTSLVAANIDIDSNGAEQGWTWNVDPSVYRILKSPVFKYGVPGSTSGSSIPSFALTYHDGTLSGGAALGLGATDLQSARTAASQSATGASSTIGGGAFNSAPGADCTVPGGVTNVCDGIGGVAEGINSTTRGRTGVQAFASGKINALGDAQKTQGILFGTTTGGAAVRLTADGAAASAVNCFNLPAAGLLYGFRVDITAHDISTPADGVVWNNWGGGIIRPTNAASTVVTMASTPTPIAFGGVSGETIAGTADTTNACLNLTFTPPNNDTWSVAAAINAVESQ